jgi:secreted Zn-dependent insulinase-like peptidase
VCVCVHVGMCSDAVEGHVLRKFGWGNKASLLTQPTASGVDVCGQLRAFHTTHYYPQNCKLVVLSPHSLEAMEVSVRQSFGQWGVKHHSLPVCTSEVVVDGPIVNGMSKFTEVFGTLPTASLTHVDASTCASECKQPTRVYRIIPMKKNYHWLTLAWVLPPTIQQYR